MENNEEKKSAMQVVADGRKEEDMCGTCTNAKGCITCVDGDQWKGGENE